jgi:hypothetical protein
MENDISNQNRKKDLELLTKNQAIKDLEIKRQKFMNYGLLALVLLIVIFVFFILKSLKENNYLQSLSSYDKNNIKKRNLCYLSAFLTLLKLPSRC